MRSRLYGMAAAVMAAVLLILVTPTGGRLAAESDGIVLEGLAGGHLSEADLEEGSAILVVWASWSPRCRDIVPRLNALRSRWSSRSRVAAVVFQEDPAAIREYLDGKGLDVPVYIDRTGAFSKKHAVTTLPGLLIFVRGETTFRGKLPTDPDPIIERALG